MEAEQTQLKEEREKNDALTKAEKWATSRQRVGRDELGQDADFWVLVVTILEHNILCENVKEDNAV